MEDQLKIQVANLTGQFETAVSQMENVEFKQSDVAAYIAGAYATMELLRKAPSETAIKQASIAMLYLSGFLEQKKLATYDSLTEVKNEREFMNDLEAAVTSQKRSKEHRREHKIKRAIAFIDLDYFKGINDTLGHVAGDKALKKIAKTLNATARTEENVYRIGGDEFALILEDHEPNNGSKNIKAAMKRFEEALSELTIEHNGIEMPLQASMGYHIIRGNETKEDLKELADRACYESKESKDARQERVWALIKSRQDQNPEIEPS